MKITAEFNSVEEVLSFASTFGKTGFIPSQGSVQAPKEAGKAIENKSVKKQEDKTPKVKAEIVSEEPPKSETIVDANSTSVGQDKPEEEEPKVTKEMVRERLGAIMKAGKQKDVKDLVAKYGASKVPDLKEEDYREIYKEAEALL